jgi:hypothetical protein
VLSCEAALSANTTNINIQPTYTLIIVGNSISELTGLTDCHSLQHFAVAHNQIERISELDRLPIKYLDLVS